MSIAIMNALKNLDQAIDRAEQLAAKPRAKPAKSGNQSDLFAAANPAPAQAGTVVNFDRTALARKLDMTIAKVEQLLGEA